MSTEHKVPMKTLIHCYINLFCFALSCILFFLYLSLLAVPRKDSNREASGTSRSHSVVNLEDEVELMEGMTLARSTPVELLLDIINFRMVQTRMG